MTLFRWLCSEGREKAQEEKEDREERGSKEESEGHKEEGALVNGKSAHL